MMLLRTMTAFALLLDGATPAATAGRLRIMGTGVSLVRPEGFFPSSMLPGLEHPDTGAYLVVTELPTSVDAFRRTFESRPAGGPAGRLVAREAIEIGGRDGLLAVFEQGSARDWQVIAGDSKATLVITARFPTKLESTLAPALRAALASILWSPPVGKTLPASRD